MMQWLGKGESESKKELRRGEKGLLRSDKFYKKR